MFLAPGLDPCIRFLRRAATSSRPVITRSLWIESMSQFLHDISDKMLLCSIPDELIINANQTPSKYFATDNVTMAAEGEKHISQTGSNDKRSITLILCELYNGTYLSSLFIKEKRQDRYQMLIFLTVFPCRIMKNKGAMKLRPIVSVMAL